MPYESLKAHGNDAIERALHVFPHVRDELSFSTSVLTFLEHLCLIHQLVSNTVCLARIQETVFCRRPLRQTNTGC
jgi:hypothetical protein